MYIHFMKYSNELGFQVAEDYCSFNHKNWVYYITEANMKIIWLQNFAVGHDKGQENDKF